MAEPTMALEKKSSINLDKLTHQVVILATTFRMGIGNMKQIADKRLETTADQTRIRSQKKLLDSPQLDEIRSQDSKMRRYLDLKTLTYLEGVDFLPVALLHEVDRALQAYQTIRRPFLVNEFMKVYRAEFAQDFAGTREALGDVFNVRDYPHPDVVENGFVFTYSIAAVESTKELARIDPSIYARETQKARAMMLEAAEEVRASLRLAGAKMVSALFEVLKPEPGKRKKLYDSHVGHLQEFLNTYNFRDITDDVEFQGHITTLRQIMEGVTVEKLRHSDNLKVAVAQNLDSLKKNIDALVITSGRKFR